MKVLDVQEVMDAIDKIKISKQQDSDNIESLRASIQKIEQLETLQGKGGEALKDHFRRLHLPVLEAFHLLIRQYMEQLDRVKSNLLGFESSSAIVREEFLSGELKNGLDRIATTATEDANEIESIRTSISDILPLTPFSMEEVLRQVDRGKDHAKETIETLHALDEQNEALLAQAESTLREVTNVVSQVANWSSGGAILSAGTLAEVDANVEALYANLVTEAIQMTPPDPFDLTGHESVMYQTALPLEFLYTGAYANIPGGLKAMSWYYMNQFPVSAMMNDEQAIQACVAPPIEQDVDEGGGWLKATFNFFKGVGSGAVNAVGDAVEGVVNLVTDPIGVYNDTVEFIGAIVDDPALVGEIATELWHAFEDDVINGDAQSRGEWTGYAIGLVGTAVVGDKGVSKVANSGQLAKLGRIGGKDGYKTRHEIELRLATQTPPTRPSLRTSMSNTRTRGVQALNTYAKNMKMSATIATGQASIAVKGATGQVKDRFVRGMDNLQTNLNGNTPALAPAGGPVNHVPYNAMDSRKIQQDVGGVKQEQLRKIEVGSG
ncbi:transposase [Bacillus sp. JCM 19047]|nr:transposase [Bacillus sp. JCM 19047]